MTITNAIKKIEKATGVRVEKTNHRYQAIFNNQVISFAQNGRYEEITNIETRILGMDDDIMTDYFCGTFHDNITQALKFIGAN
jgi:hypothetical protein